LILRADALNLME